MPLKTYWISFVSKAGALGVVVTAATSSREALKRVTRLGQNPGGEAVLLEIPDDPAAVAEVGKYPRDVLISPEALRAGGAIRVGDARSYDPEAGTLVMAEYVCEPCNEGGTGRIVA